MHALVTLLSPRSVRPPAREQAGVESGCTPRGRMVNPWHGDEKEVTRQGRWGLTQVLSLRLTGGFFLIGGVVLFFDRAMLAMGNILFLIGLTIIIGPQKTLMFFARKQKAKGTGAFFLGLLLILLRWPLIGFCVELYGILILFGDFLGTIASFARGIPVVGPYVGMVVDRLGLGARRNAELPV